ncbi:endonuclease/exonuclease/phosphatase family protein [Rickettsiales endosymbiont of Stachyamoeba lipophora]|uniref:endonuclease/exonuclease/phosphatase family protein n=1 Tax=Rickettsiales endosymbiont of Stachyamoeba lipophora TaxID=2486578 RepID=UPI000F64959D|nr:endonuclease/exonuclease/phosphatase family protein [Rickettsiales endosymbiont of Stachyamoeba lipophora]AZL16066.1 endonuclease/exonuclease/phosphatase family protein [Rickettsiales endosymbiont of Stachyamoeba lipophora]
MGKLKILFSNLGYARGFNGYLKQHILHLYRHIYCPPNVQRQVLLELKNIINLKKPDIGCVVEIDQGSLNSAYFNQIEHLIDINYPFFDIENKYSQNSYLNKLPIFNGKCNAFFAKLSLNYQKLYFTYGTKKLIYKINLINNITLFFAHFSLKKNVRAKQYQEICALAKNEPGEVIIMGDFNNFLGFNELLPFTHDANLSILNDQKIPTFTFHIWQYPIDLCICSSSLLRKLHLEIIPQPFSDHSALLLTIASLP